MILTVSAGSVLAQGRLERPGRSAAARTLSSADSLTVRQFYYTALREKMIENFQLAADMFRQVIDIDPLNDAAMYELAGLYSARNEDEKAEQYIKSAISINPDNEWYWLLLGDIYKQNNQLPELVTVFNELIRLKPEAEEFYFDKANAFMRQRKTAEAAAVYAEIEKLFGSSDELSEARQRLFVQSGKPDKAIDDLERQIVQNPAEIKNYIYLSELYGKEGDRDKALDILKKALVLEPSNALVRLSLADIYRSAGKFDNAFTELKAAFADTNLPIDQKVRIILSFFPLFTEERARNQAEELAGILVKVHKDDPKAHAVLGDVLFQLQKYPEAKVSYQAALKLNDQVYLIWEQLLRLDISDGDFKQAIQDGESALSVFPNQAPLYLYTGIAYAQVQQYDKAVSYLKNASALETEDKDIQAQIYSALGDAYNAMKRYRESDQSYERALELAPDNVYTLNNYAYYLSLRGESLSKAEQMSRRSNKLQPDNSSFEDTLAWILFKAKNYSEAKIWIEKAIKKNKNSGIQFEHYGDILFHLGDRVAALDAWKKAKAAGSKSGILDRKINEKKYTE